MFLENRDELENIIVDACGVIHDTSNKIFLSNVLQERQEILAQEKICKSIKQSNKRQIEEKIKKDCPIFDKENSCNKPAKKKKSNENQQYFENMSNYNKQVDIKSVTKSNMLVSQPYRFPTCMEIPERTYGKSKDQRNLSSENFQVITIVKNCAFYYINNKKYINCVTVYPKFLNSELLNICN